MKAQLLQQPQRFEFFQAVRLIERELKAQGGRRRMATWRCRTGYAFETAFRWRFRLRRSKR